MPAFRTLATLMLAASACGGSDPAGPPPPPPPPAPVATVTLSSAAESLVLLQTVQLTATLRDAQGGVVTGRAVAWSSSADGVATVSGSGLVTAAATGTALITATSEGKSAQAAITVAAGWWLGPAGGSFTTADGSVKLTVPSGSLTAGTPFQVAQATGIPADPLLIAGTAVTLSPAGVAFPAPATLQIRYPTGLPASVVLSQLRLGRLVNNAWQPLASASLGAPMLSGALDGWPWVVDLPNRLVSGPITVSGTYAVLAPLPSLRGYAQARGIHLGTAVTPAGVNGSDPVYAGLVRAEFNAVVAENVMKFGPIHPGPATYAFGGADAMVQFAEQQGMAVHGHTLLWHSQQPDWITTGSWTRTTLLAALKSHVETVVNRYRGKIALWDVANEVVADQWDATATPDGLRNTFWIQIIGPDVIDSVFAWTARIDPAAKLYLNDYAIEHPVNDNVKRARLLALAQRLKTAGIPIHGIGLQSHFTLQAPSRTQLSQSLALFTSAGFDVRFSELDVRIPDSAPESELDTQATVYRDVVAACLGDPRCRAITTWGFSDRYSWIPGFFPSFGRALPFDRDFLPKPAYSAISEELRGSP